MRNLTLRIAAVLALAAGLAAPLTAQAKLPSEFFGVVIQNPLNSEDIAKMKGANVGSVRFQVYWRGIEVKDNKFDWASTDSAIGSAAKAGAVAIPYILGVPKFVSEKEVTPPIRSAKAKRNWKEINRQLVKRYGPGGNYWRGPFQAQFPGAKPKPVRIWQIWNEPSSTTYWGSKPNVKQYGALLKLAENAIHNEDRKARIMLGGVCCSPRGGLDAWVFLEKLYKLNGIKSSFDYVALHPYAPGIKGMKAQVELARDVMKKAGDGGTKVWLTEFGWASGGTHPNLVKGIQGQAKILKQSFGLIKQKKQEWNVAGVSWFALRDAPDGSACPFCQFMGLLKDNGDQKPSWAAFKSFSSKQR